MAEEESPPSTLQVAPSEEEFVNIAKEVFEDVLGNKHYDPLEFVKWNSQIVETITQRLANMERPFKYCVSCMIMQSGLGSGLNVSNTCFWDKVTDRTYTYRWEGKHIIAVAIVFAVYYNTRV